MMELTVRGIPKELAEAMRKESELRGLTLEETVLAILGEGLAPTQRCSNGLRQFAGDWSEEDVREFERNTAPFREIGPEMWRSGHG